MIRCEHFHCRSFDAANTCDRSCTAIYMTQCWCTRTWTSIHKRRDYAHAQVPAHAQLRAAHTKHSRPAHVETARECMEMKGTTNEMQCSRESTIWCEFTNRVLFSATRVCLLVAVLVSARLASLVRRSGWQYVLAAISITCDRIGCGRRLVKRRGDVVGHELVRGRRGRKEE